MIRGSAGDHRDVADDHGETEGIPRSTSEMIPRSRVRLEIGTDADSSRAHLKRRVLEHLEMQGFELSDNGLRSNWGDSKDEIRKLHSFAVQEQIAQARKPLASKESQFVARLADPGSVRVSQMRPKVVEITDKKSFDAALFRWACLHWSIPVSRGYARRIRFIVIDEANHGALMGIIGLGDPVYALRPRDTWIGWTPELRKVGLTSIMDAFVLGGVPPYTSLRAGKLIALLATSPTVRNAFERKYSHRRTEIRGRDPNAHLAVITTLSALGRSSLYNRLRHESGDPAFIHLGPTTGSGDFQFSGSIYKELANIARESTPENRTYRNALWSGTGYRNKRETIQRGLSSLGLSADKLRLHGIQRQIYAAPLARNAIDFLNGRNAQPEWPDYSDGDLIEWWKRRWALPREAVTDEHLSFEPSSWRLWQPDD